MAFLRFTVDTKVEADAPGREEIAETDPHRGGFEV